MFALFRFVCFALCVCVPACTSRFFQSPSWWTKVSCLSQTKLPACGYRVPASFATTIAGSSLCPPWKLNQSQANPLHSSLQCSVLRSTVCICNATMQHHLAPCCDFSGPEARPRTGECQKVAKCLNIVRSARKRFSSLQCRSTLYWNAASSIV